MNSMPKEIKIALLMAASLFMEILDGTIVTTALPKMAQYFHTSPATIALTVSVYLITVAIFIPLSGWSEPILTVRPVDEKRYHFPWQFTGLRYILKNH